MIINGHFIPGEPHEAYLSAAWDRAEGRRSFRHRPRFDIRERRRKAYHRSDHADWTWAMARYGLGRVRIVHTRHRKAS